MRPRCRPCFQWIVLGLRDGGADPGVGWTKEQKNVPQHQDAVQFRTARHRGRNPGLRATIREETLRLQQAFPGQCRGVRPRGGGGNRLRPPPADLAAYACAGARPRDRSREGEGAIEAEVWVKPSACAKEMLMAWYVYVAWLFAGAFLANAIPHTVQGICGNRFQTPFASPRGVGDPPRSSTSSGVLPISRSAAVCCTSSLPGNCRRRGGHVSQVLWARWQWRCTSPNISARSEMDPDFGTRG